MNIDHLSGLTDKFCGVQLFYELMLKSTLKDNRHCIKLEPPDDVIVRSPANRPDSYFGTAAGSYRDALRDGGQCFPASSTLNPSPSLILMFARTTG